MRRAPLAVLVFVAWTEIVWVGRVRNVMATDGWSAADLVLPLMFVGLGLAVVAVLLAPVPPPVRTMVVRGAAAVTTVVWLVRVGFIAVHDHSIGFKIVHFVLAAISIVLAAWAMQATASVGDDRDAAATV